MTSTLTSAETAVAAQPIDISDFSAYYGSFEALRGVSMTIEPRAVTAFIGPSGCGKSTMLRSINRMHETIPGASVEGTITLGGEDLYDRRVDPVAVRSRIGMVFQRPNPFPTMSIRDNVLVGVRLQGRRLGRSDADDLVEMSLRAANLWEPVKDILSKAGGSLSGGQQQRLCIARAIAVKPDVLLMDEPCSALDPISTAAIEELIANLRRDYTVVIVTHNMGQALRVSDTTAFFTVDGPGRPGRLIEYGDTKRMFDQPAEQQTADYLAGRFG